MINSEINIEALFKNILYFSFVMLGLYLIINSGEYLIGLSLFTLAIIFDPLKIKVDMKEKPLHHKIFIIVHLLAAITTILFALSLIVR